MDRPPLPTLIGAVALAGVGLIARRRMRAALLIVEMAGIEDADDRMADDEQTSDVS
jgi:hypothetical protein